MRKLSSRFSIAVHVLTLTAAEEKSCTSEFIAGSVNTNPVVIRRVLGYLKKAGIVKVHPGTGGTALTRDISDITLLDVYKAVEVTEGNSLFNFHNGNVKCRVGANIQSVLGETLSKAQKAMEDELRKVTIKDILEGINKASEDI